MRNVACDKVRIIPTYGLLYMLHAFWFPEKFDCQMTVTYQMLLHLENTSMLQHS